MDHKRKTVLQQILEDRAIFHKIDRRRNYNSFPRKIRYAMWRLRKNTLLLCDKILSNQTESGTIEEYFGELIDNISTNLSSISLTTENRFLTKNPDNTVVLTDATDASLSSHVLAKTTDFFSPDKNLVMSESNNVMDSDTDDCFSDISTISRLSSVEHLNSDYEMHDEMHGSRFYQHKI